MTRNRFIVIITTSSTQVTHLYVFLEVILDQQATTYIKNRNMIEHALQPRIEREKTDFVAVTFSRNHYVRSVGFRYRDNTEM